MRRVVRLACLPLLHFPDDNGFRTHQLADSERISVVAMLKLDNLLPEHLLEPRAFHDSHIQI